jgi:hypothetical protein
MQGLPATLNGVPRNREISTRDCLAQGCGCDACELPGGLKKRVVAQLKPHAAPGLIMMVIESVFLARGRRGEFGPARRYSVVNVRNSSRATSPKSLRCEPIDSEWSVDVRFGAHSGLRSDIEALPKIARFGSRIWCPIDVEKRARCTTSIEECPKKPRRNAAPTLGACQVPESSPPTNPPLSFGPSPYPPPPPYPP